MTSSSDPPRPQPTPAAPAASVCCTICSTRLQLVSTAFSVELHAPSSFFTREQVQTHESGCAVCFGLFGDVWAENVTDSRILSDLIGHMTNDGYDIDEYALGVELPSSLMIRETSVLWEQHQRPCDRFISVKDALRACIIHRLNALSEGRFTYVHVCELDVYVYINQGDRMEDEGRRLTHMLTEAGANVGSRHTRGRPNHKKRQKEAGTKGPSPRVAWKTVEQWAGRLSPQLLTKYHFLPASSGTLADLDILVHIQRAPICVSGFYTKLCRTLSQTPFFEHVAASSVQGEISQTVLPVFGATKVASFHGSGREDVDVRMLGNGRLFMMEIQGCKVNPRAPLYQTREFWTQLEAQVNAGSDDVQVHSLRLADRKLHGVMEASSEEKEKSYRCVCLTSVPITHAHIARINEMGARPFDIQQRTPTRVCHRRVNMTRPRTISAMSAEFVNMRCFFLDLTTQAGTYVKEFVHSDRGRTTPSLSSIVGCSVDIVQLDVMQVHESITLE